MQCHVTEQYSRHMVQYNKSKLTGQMKLPTDTYKVAVEAGQRYISPTQSQSRSNVHFRLLASANTYDSGEPTMNGLCIGVCWQCILSKFTPGQAHLAVGSLRNVWWTYPIPLCFTPLFSDSQLSMPCIIPLTSSPTRMVPQSDCHCYCWSKKASA